MPTALIVSRYFPPLGPAGASIRLVKLMKYAAEKGWSFLVLTQDPDRPVVPEKRLSEFLLAEIPAGTEINRKGNPFSGFSAFFRLGRRIARKSSLPWGVSVGWLAWKKYRHSKPDLVFVNSPPFTNVAVGLFLAVAFAVPLVMDMKDDWVGSPVFARKGTLRRVIESWIEKRVVRKASAVITVTRASHQAFLKRYPSPDLAGKIFCIPNGVDIEEYTILRGRQRKAEGQRFLLLSAAAGYRPDYRDLAPFLQALELFLQRHPQMKDQLEIEFLGEDPDSEYKAWLERLLSPSAVHYRGALDRQALVERLWQADLFFLVQPRGNSSAISGTLYEYWATGKAPVLLISETGASSDLVTGHALGAHFRFDQLEEASTFIESIVRNFISGHPAWIESSGVEAYDRRKSVTQMLSIWSDLASNTRRS